MRPSLAGAAAVIGVVACGGSTPAPATGTSAPATVTRATTTTKGAPTASYPQTTSRTSTTGASAVRLPATFTIEAGDRLTPPSVTAPAGVLIDVTLISGDGELHRVTVGGKALVVPAGGRTYIPLTGLHKGRYPVSVDGVPRGTLVVGGQPGP